MTENDVPEIVVLNKADIADDEAIAQIRAAEPGALLVSAATGAGFPELIQQIADALPRPAIDVDLVTPHARGDLLTRAHVTREVESEEHLATGTDLIGRVDAQLAEELHGVAVGNSDTQ